MGTVNPGDPNGASNTRVPAAGEEQVQWLKICAAGFVVALVSVVLLVAALWWRGRCCSSSRAAVAREAKP